uniref:Uncharacterized protein n=1 Tax=Rhizophora mucronata TaxID=61149 RepID=A0A2P2IHU3_RHIMU
MQSPKKNRENRAIPSTQIKIMQDFK